MKQPKTITIICPSDTRSHFDVFIGEEFTDGLCWEEMLGQIATLTHSEITTPRFPVLTADEFVDQKISREIRRLKAQVQSSRFTNTQCSQCGAEFGPGDHGFSHCENHTHLQRKD